MVHRLRSGAQVTVMLADIASATAVPEHHSGASLRGASQCAGPCVPAVGEDGKRHHGRTADVAAHRWLPRRRGESRARAASTPAGPGWRVP